MNSLNNSIKIKDKLVKLINEPSSKPFLFRTRFERTMLQIINFAKVNNNENLYGLSSKCLKKMKGICDKSNMTSDGLFRSYCLLLDDMKVILNAI